MQRSKLSIFNHPVCDYAPFTSTGTAAQGVGRGDVAPRTLSKNCPKGEMTRRNLESSRGWRPLSCATGRGTSSKAAGGGLGRGRAKGPARRAPAKAFPPFAPVSTLAFYLARGWTPKGARPVAPGVASHCPPALPLSFQASGVGEQRANTPGLRCSNPSPPRG